MLQLKEGGLDKFLLQTLGRPYILITGQSDWGVPSTDNARRILDDPNLVAWYAQNNDESHAKIHPIPIGLNCFEHVREMHQARQLLAAAVGEGEEKAKDDVARPPLVEKQHLMLVNFGHTHQDRKKVSCYSSI